MGRDTFNAHRNTLEGYPRGLSQYLSKLCSCPDSQLQMGRKLLDTGVQLLPGNFLSLSEQVFESGFRRLEALIQPLHAIGQLFLPDFQHPIS